MISDQKPGKKNGWNYLYLAVVISLCLTIAGLYYFMISFS